MKTVQRDRDERTPEEKIQVSPEELDVEWCRIARDIYQAAEAVTDAEENVLLAEAKKTKVMTERDLEIRQAPSVFGLEKLTEAGVKSVLLDDKAVQKADEKCRHARLIHSRAKNLVTGLTEKRRALENLVTLHGLNYFAEPRDKTGVGEKMRREKTTNRINERLTTKGK